MKKYFAILTIVGIGCLYMTSCDKSSQDAINLTANQPQTLNEYHSFNCQFLPAAEYAKISVAKTSNAELSKTIVNLNVPPIGDQGTGSSAAWGTTYEGRSIDWQANHPASWNPKVNIFSPDYTVKLNGCTNPLYVTTALNLLISQGACVIALVTNPDCAVPPTLTQIANAAQHRINGYSTVPITTAAIKSIIASGRPVIVAGSVNNAFLYYTSGVLTTFSGSPLGGHCYCIVGYDDTKGAFKFMNSWGTTWGISGFGYIAYGYESSWWSEAYVIN
ncbi:MAG: C1 family peptidase [Bacteroidales bacterium]|nr:C1 family peptidase [Bacteroidales bacterium]